MKSLARSSALPLIGILTGCAGTGKAPDPRLSAAPADRRLVVLHASDLEGELVGNGESGGIARFVAVVEALRRSAEVPTITVAAGDTFMPAPALQVELDGANAVSAANALVGLEASGLGNHEFDKGEDFLAERIRAAGFPYLTATVDFEGGSLDAIDVENEAIAGNTPWLAEHPGRILPRGLLCAGGTLERGESGGLRCTGLTVGVIGATTETLRTISSTSVTVGLPADFAALRRRVQEQADALAAEGVDIVVLLSHLQDVRREIALVDEGLTGVDVVVSGGGDDRLADPDDRLLGADEPHALCAEARPCYPLIRTAADGRPVAVVATDGQLRYVGKLGLRFDAAGVIAGIDADAGPVPVDDRSVAALGTGPDPAAAALEARVRGALDEARTTLAQSRDFLDGERESVRNRETNLGNLAADSMAWAAGRPAAFALRNGGGIRASIGRIDGDGERTGGAITRLDLREAFRFDNEIVLVTAPHRVLVESLESALRGAGTGRGHFPQVSEGVELVYDPAAPEQVQTIVDGEVVGVEQPGRRIRRLVVPDPAGGRRVVVEAGRVLEPERPISFATLSYLARGGDGWFPGAADAIEIRPLGVHEQQALADFLADRAASGSWNEGAAYADFDAAEAKRILRRQ